MRSLHSNKLVTEKDIFIEELYNSLPSKEEILTGAYKNRARRIHEVFFPVYIMKHYCKGSFISEYVDKIFTNVIESECLFFLGFKNSAMMGLRGAVELTFKFLFYEFHPIENQLHNIGKHDLTGLQYREFLYSFPRLSEISFINKIIVEKIWGELCKYAHCDLQVLEGISFVSDISSVLKDERETTELINSLKEIIKLIITLLFATKPGWLEGVEKSYFDYVLEIYSSDEREEVKLKLQII